MKSKIIFTFFIFNFVFGQTDKLPDWFLNSYKSLNLDSKFEQSKLLNPNFLLIDLNGDKLVDVAIGVRERETKKTGILVINQNSNNFFIIGANSRFGKIGFDDFNELDWVTNWEILKDKTAYETKFDNGDIIGSQKINLKFNSISIWKAEDGSALYGGIIYWDGKKYSWIHQGE
jgi:hypothetical protein